MRTPAPPPPGSSPDNLPGTPPSYFYLVKGQGEPGSSSHEGLEYRYPAVHICVVFFIFEVDLRLSGPRLSSTSIIRHEKLGVRQLEIT